MFVASGLQLFVCQSFAKNLVLRRSLSDFTPKHPPTLKENEKYAVLAPVALYF